MSQQVGGTTRKISDSSCSEAYANSLKCERSSGTLAPPGTLDLLACLLAPCKHRQSAREWPGAAVGRAPPFHCCRYRRPRDRLPLYPAGLDKNKYDKAKCKDAFDAYKKCKKDQASCL